MRSNRMKMLSATVGTSAVLAMGGLTVAFSTVSSAQPEPAPTPAPSVVEGTPPTTITTRDEPMPAEPPSGESTPPGPPTPEEE